MASDSGIGAGKIAIIGLVVTLCGAVLGWHGSYLQSRHSLEQSCIERLDARELLLREKGASLLGSIGRFAGETTYADNTEARFREHGTEVIARAMTLMAYAPPELGGSVVNVIGTMQYGLMARTVEEQERAMELASTAMRDWPIEFQTLMEEFEQRREACR
ncbi:hypothetical protein [Halomonas sp. H5]|uniref:hypothetical protein n=1 Tax=Halomonas sp. H5 TaxID=3423910 RepID=UPI003D368734